MTTTSATLPASPAGGRQGAVTTAYYLAFVGLGLITASLGPTLSGLAAHTASPLNAISVLFTTRALGYLCGSFIGGRIYDRLPGHPILATMLGVMIVMTLAVPMIPSLWLLAAVLLLLGMGEGTLDVGINTLIVWLHRPNVEPYMNALHFFFGVGTVIAPLIVAQSIRFSADISWAYWIFGLLLIPILVWLARLPSPTADHPAVEKDDLPVDYVLTGLVAFFLFIYVGIEGSFSGWIDKYAIATGHATELTASYWTSLFWFTFTLGRLFSIPLATKLRPRALLAGGLTGGLLCVVTVLLWPASQSALVIGTGGAGLFMAALFPVMLTWAGRRMRITGFVTSWFFVGASTGGMFFPWFIGQFFESSGPLITMLTVLVSLLLGLGMFGVLMLYAGKPRLVKESKN